MRTKRNIFRRFFIREEGSILIESLLAIPLVTIFSAGILEYGNVLWQRQQVQAGVRDAARYWSRCRPVANGNPYMPCDATIARNIAFYGNPTGTGALRVPNWNTAAGLLIFPATPPTVTTSDDKAIVTGIATYNASPVFHLLQIDPITMQYQFEMRYVGW